MGSGEYGCCSRSVPTGNQQLKIVPDTDALAMVLAFLLLDNSSISGKYYVYIRAWMLRCGMDARIKTRGEGINGS